MPDPLLLPRAPRHACRRDERGSSTLELAVIAPVLLLAVFGLIQGALWYHARVVALNAAQSAVSVARASDGTDADGRRAARAFITRAGGADILLDVNVDTTRTGDAVDVAVTGRAPSVIPGIRGRRVTQHARGPLERITTP